MVGRYNVSKLVSTYGKQQPQMYDEIVELVESLDKNGLAILLVEVGRQLAN
jgi:hypothetical protein